MAVPAHDTRDYAFAKKFNLEIIPVLEGGDITKEAYTEDGIHINSGFLNGMDKPTAIKTMLEYLEAHSIGKKKSIISSVNGFLLVKDIGESQFLLYI